MKRIPEVNRIKKEEISQEKSTNRRKTGSRYEVEAERYLREQGYEILKRNYYCRAGEIDLIARQEGIIVFCEVKYRRNLSAGHPLEAVDRKKQQTIMTCARCYLMEHGYKEVCCRFDVIGFLGEELFHIPDAFSCCS